MAQQLKASNKQDRVELYEKQVGQLRELRQQFNLNSAASGDWNTQSIKTLSATEQLTNKIRQQKLGLGELRRSWGTMNEVAKEQVALRNSMATQIGGANMFGRQTIDLHTPKNLGPELNSARIKYGLINQAIASAAHQTINWGKNTQWAGRQITVGLTMPLGMAAVGAAALALEVDKNLTRIAKVYDTTATDAMGQERELANLREDSLALATNMAQEYGASMESVLDIEAQLASTGLNGRELMQSTAEATRIATLGELDYQQAIDMTVALQTAFKLSNEELTDSFNFMNSVENATSLSIQDIAEATPRAASALSALGGTVQDMTVMLVAMRESGVDAAEGANALKSATSRLLNPTAAAVSYFQETFGIDLKKVVDDAGGNIYTIMQNLAGMTDGYDELAKQRGIQELFGTYQFNRVTALWDNLGDAMTGTMNQTAQAMEVAGQTTEQWADVAANEVERWQNSIQGKFKTAVEGIKAELVPLGMAALQVITPIMNFIGSAISGFNGLSGPIKTIIISLLGLAAIAGPLLMLVGIFANLFGNITKMGTNIANLSLKFKALSSQEAANALMQRQMTSKFDSEARSAGLLAYQISSLTREMERNAVASGLMARANADGTFQVADRRVGKNAKGQPVYTQGDNKGKVVSPADMALISQAQTGTKDIANNAEKTKRSFGGASAAAGALGVAAIGMGVFADQSSKTNQAITSSLMGLSLVATLIPGIGSAFKNVNANAAAGNSTIKAMGTSLASFGRTALRILGPVGVIAGGLFMMIDFVASLNDAEEAAARLNNTSSLWAEHMGYDEIDIAEKSPFLSLTEQATAGAAALRELAAAGNEAALAVIAGAEGVGNTTELITQAINQGIQAYNTGASVEDAQQVMREVLELGAGAAGLTPVELDNLQLEIGEIDLSDPEQLTEAISTNIGSAMDTALSTQQQNIGDKFANWFLTSSVTGTVSEWVTGVLGLDTEYDRAVERTTDDFTAALGILTGNLNQLMSSAATDFQKNELFDDVQVQFHNGIRQNFEDFNAAMKTEFSNQDFEYFREVYEEMGSLEGLDLDLDFVQLAQLESLFDNQATALDAMIQSIGEANGWTQDQIDSIRTLAELQRALIPPTLSSAEATGRYAEAMKKAQLAGKKLSSEQHTNLVDSLLLASGLDVAGAAAVNLFGPNTANILKRYIQDAKNEAAGLNTELRGGNKPKRGQDMNPNSERNLERRTKALEAENDAISDAGEAREKAIQDAGDARSKAIDAQGKAQDKAFDAQSKAEDKQFEQRQDALESHWDAIDKMTEDRQNAEQKALENAYDGRKKAIEDQIEVEEKAEEARQRIFDAEEKRISRMAARANRSIDFNAALNSGDLDAAAKIFNDASATEASWSLEDAQATAGDASKQRTEALQAQIDAIDEEKKIRLDALDEVHKAEDQANKDRRDAAKEQLDLEKEIAKERLDAARTAAQEANQLASEAASNATEAALESARAATEAALEAAQNRFDAESNSTSKILDVRKGEASATAVIGKGADEEVDKEKRKKMEAYKQWLAKQQRWSGDNDIKEQERGGRLGTYGQALEVDKHMVATKKKYKALADYYADQTDIGAETGRVNATGRINKFKKDTEVTYRNIGITLGDEQGAGAEQARIKVAQKMAEIRQNAAQKYAEIGQRLDAEITAGAERGKANTKSKMQGMVLSDPDSLSQKFTWLGGQLAAQIHSGADTGRHRAQHLVDWGGAGNDIGGKIAGTVGLDVGQLKNWLKTGDYPGANWKKALSKHDGGVVLHGGGSPGWSSKDRTGVPRSAGLYPSEVPAILKRGEFVVNEKATRANLGTLEQINSGKPVQMPHGPAVVRHEGGMWAPGAVAAVGGSAMAEMQANKTLQAVEMLAKIQSEKLNAAATYSAASAGGDSGSFTPGAGGGGGSNGVFRTTNRNFPAPRQGVVAANTAAAKAFVQANFPGVGSIGTLGSRPNKSDHPMGKAIDNMIPNYRSPQGIALGTSIADWFIQNPNVFGTKYVIWRDRIAESNGKGWQPYRHPTGQSNDTLQHRDHPHVSFYHKGGQAAQEMGGFNLPQLNTGGFIKYDNTMANLHKDESVLTAPLTEKFKAGLDGVANGSNTSYDVVIDLRGAYIKEEIDVEAAVERAIAKKENKIGRSRSIGR